MHIGIHTTYENISQPKFFFGWLTQTTIPILKFEIMYMMLLIILALNLVSCCFSQLFIEVETRVFVVQLDLITYVNGKNLNSSLIKSVRTHLNFHISIRSQASHVLFLMSSVYAVFGKFIWISDDTMMLQQSFCPYRT